MNCYFRWIGFTLYFLILLTQVPNHWLEKSIILKAKIYNTESFNLSQVLKYHKTYINNSIIYSFNSSEFKSYMIYQSTKQTVIFFSILIKIFDVCYNGLQTGDFRNWEKSRSFSLLFLLIVTNSKEELEMLVYMIGCYKIFFRVEAFVSFLSNREKENMYLGACTHTHTTL